MASGEIADFVRAAKAGGASDAALVALLRQRGWSEAAVYDALAEYYENVTGMSIPQRRRSAESAREAFLYLLTFATLGTWTIGLGSLLFTLIEIAFPDFVQPRSGMEPRYSLSGQLAAVLVAFPIFLFATRATLREISGAPEKLESPVRRWLTYIALFLAATIVICDLITFVAYFLRGELTARFVLKVLTVFVIAGGVFWYYLSSMRPQGFARRANLATAIAAVVVIVGAGAAGMAQLGSHGMQRGIEADARRVQDIKVLGAEIQRYRETHPALPASLDELEKAAPYVHVRDPVTGKPYGYRKTSDTAYELCATFQGADTEPRSGRFWIHPGGPHCYRMDTRLVQQ